MKIPRDLSGAELVKRLARLGYATTRQTGSHIRLTSTVQGEHHITLPNHDPLKVGTLAAILPALRRIMASTATNCFTSCLGRWRPKASAESRCSYASIMLGKTAEITHDFEVAEG